MSDTLHGGCLCGAVRFECRAAPMWAVFCHCRDCQRAHAAPYAACASMPPNTVEIVSGQPIRYEVIGNSGAGVFREFCGRCGTHLFSGTSALPQFKTVKIAALDEPERISPIAHVWTERLLPWACIDDGLPRFLNQVQVGDLERLWAERCDGVPQHQGP